MTTFFWIAQALGAVAILFQIGAYQNNSRKHILFGVMCAQILFVVHFILLGAYTGAAVNAIGATRNLIFAKSKNIVKSNHLLWLFLAVQLLVSTLTWGGMISIFALFGAWFSTLAFWQHDPKNIRKIIIFMPICWLVYNYFVHSYIGMASNIFVLVSAIVAIFRFDLLPKLTRERIL